MYDTIIKLFPEKLVFSQYEIAIDNHAATGMRVYTVAAIEILSENHFIEIWERGSALITAKEWEQLKNASVEVQ